MAKVYERISAFWISSIAVMMKQQGVSPHIFEGAGVYVATKLCMYNKLGLAGFGRRRAGCRCGANMNENEWYVP